MEWLVLLSCIIFIEFVKNSRNLLVYFDFTSFVLRFEKNLQKPEGTAHLPQATASSMFGKSAGIPLELPSDKVMCHACHVCHVWHQNVTCIAASGTSYVFYELSSSFVQSFAWVSDGLSALQSLKISQVSTKQLQNSSTLNSDLRVIHHQWRPPDLATFQVSVNCTWNKADLKHWLAGFAGFVLAQSTELAWDFWKFHGVWEVQKSKTQQSCWSDFGPVLKICQSGVSFEHLFHTEAIVDFISCSGKKHSRNLFLCHIDGIGKDSLCEMATWSPQNCSTLAQHW